MKVVIKAEVYEFAEGKENYKDTIEVTFSDDLADHECLSLETYRNIDFEKGQRLEVRFSDLERVMSAFK